ncbi:short-chain dehydrogenase/reductase family 16C member 6 [Zerene cesonia]|uniref:short-chain dehydrogenase/reductase family 16C member 6 n=1 Tax=Zerene cesonia TaxID=33412 RepID=UPI0018E51B56|nr:short-chain dehydrogenase/reductase family 16C member 6 [Zerene cesonia]XP_038222470.1 short-chain dehydrogenase/reductase family 16C member 6 [Zerene cesonia]
MLEGSKLKKPSQVASIFDIAKDTVLFLVLSCYYILESLFWTLVPNAIRPMKSLKGDVVLVTGGGGGVGKQLALKLARLGAKVVVWDINEEALRKTCNAVTDEGYEIASNVVDLADRNAVYKAAEKVKKEVGKVDVLINNAGVVFGETLLELNDNAIETTYKVNILSHYWTVKAFLPDMIETGKGHIVTVGSVAGLLGTYRCTDYSATKFATVGFHESLFTELRAHGHNTIQATLVCPYYINTGMFDGVTPRLMPMLEPDYVAETMIDSIRKNEVNCIMPGSVRYLLPLKCLLPAKMCWDLMHRVMKGPQSMMELKRKPQAA